MPYLELPSTRIFFTDTGTGAPTLVLLHGGAEDSNHWNWVSPLLANDYRVVALDLRGHGHSSPGQGYQLADFTGDVLAVADHLSVERIVPVGHSLGGAIGAYLAVEHPDRVHAVVEIDAAYSVPPFVVDWWEAGLARWRARQDSRAVTADLEVPRSPVTPDFLATWVQRGMEAMDPAVFWAAYEAIAYGPEQMFAPGPEADAYLRRRKCPVLSINAMPGRAQWESALFQHPASHALEWEGSSHWLYIERYCELAAVITGWLHTLPDDIAS